MAKEILWEKAESGNVTMQIWQTKNILGYADKQEVTGASGQPLVTTFVFQIPDGTKVNPFDIAKGQ